MSRERVRAWRVIVFVSALAASVCCSFPSPPRPSLEQVGKENASGYAGVVLDDCNFHECVNLDDFESTRTLALIPPDGEFVVMNYRITSEFRPPFRIFPVLEESSPYKIELVLKVREMRLFTYF